MTLVTQHPGSESDGSMTAETFNAIASRSRAGRSPHAAGTIGQSPRGYAVTRHGSPPDVTFIDGLATKSEAYKVLYGLANGWSRVVVRMRSGEDLTLRLRDTIRARLPVPVAATGRSVAVVVCDECGEPVHPGARCREPHTL